MDSSTCLVPTSFCYVLSVWSHIFQKQRGERKKERRKEGKKERKKKKKKKKKKRANLCATASASLGPVQGVWGGWIAVAAPQ